MWGTIGGMPVLGRLGNVTLGVLVTWAVVTATFACGRSVNHTGASAGDEGGNSSTGGKGGDAW